MSRGQRNGSPRLLNLGFLDRSRHFSIQVATQLSSRGWVDPVPDPLLLRKSGSAGNRTWDLWICSQELWPLDHRGDRKLTIRSLYINRMKFRKLKLQNNNRKYFKTAYCSKWKFGRKCQKRKNALGWGHGCPWLLSALIPLAGRSSKSTWKIHYKLSSNSYYQPHWSMTKPGLHRVIYGFLRDPHKKLINFVEIEHGRLTLYLLTNFDFPPY
jgi:hypothetical protein